jgi:valyl-tRNA synthetase
MARAAGDYCQGTYSPIVIRFKRMQGFGATWIPGLDHAGFETQFVYEKHLAKAGKSRMDFDRETLYQDIYAFVQENSGLIYTQFKRLGFSADWKRSVFTLDPAVIAIVYKTFETMEAEGLVYRDNYIVNYCIHDGTSLAELEVKHVERQDPLYYVRYPLMDDPTTFVVVATVRPEPIYIDTHLAVHPDDKKNQHLIGKKVKNPLTNHDMTILADSYVDPEFGTGIVKLTPGHDANDFSVAKKHNLPIIQAIDHRGRMIEIPNTLGLHGLKVKEAREKVVGLLQEKGLIDHIDETYTHSVITCYKCGRDLEPLTTPNWFIKVKDLKAEVKTAVETDQVKFYPKKFKRHMLSWLDVMHDWPISRQVVWGIRIPVWYKIDRNHDNITVTFLDTHKAAHHGSLKEFLQSGTSLDEIKKGLQQVIVIAEETKRYVISDTEPTDGEYIQETDTFDTWFSSGQWPLVTLQESEFPTHFPTDFMGTLSDILKFWISRMILFSLHLKKTVPFKNVYLWSMVADSKGVKMSKSKGNVINPIELIDKYGADALRMSILYGTPAGSKVILSEDKVRGMRNFSNKIWNAARFLQSLELETGDYSHDPIVEGSIDQWIHDVTNYLEQYKFDKAIEYLYTTLWHVYCDDYIEKAKKGLISKPVMDKAFRVLITLLHPFAPFVTEAIWQEYSQQSESSLLATTAWPTS